MRTLFLFFGLMAWLLNSTAQVNYEELALKQKGSWKVLSEKHYERVSPAEKAECKPVLDRFQQLVKNSLPAPEGFNFYLWNDFKLPNEPALGDFKTKSYRTIMQVKEFGVNSKNEIGELSKTRTTLSIQVNSFWKVGDRYAFGNDTLIGLPRSRKMINGIDYFERNYGNSLDTLRCFLITRDISQLLIPYTRKAYLEKKRAMLKNEVEQKKEAVKRSYKLRTANEQLAEKNNGLEKLAKRYKGEELKKKQAEFLAAYKTDNQLLSELIVKIQQDQQDQIDRIEKLLQNDENWLNQIAVVQQGSNAFFDFDDDKPNSWALYSVNPSYFKADLSKVKPQFIAVIFSQESESVASVKWNKQMLQLPFSSLKELLQ